MCDSGAVGTPRPTNDLGRAGWLSPPFWRVQETGFNSMWIHKNFVRRFVVVAAWALGVAATQLVNAANLPVHSFPLNPYCQVLDGQWQGTRFASDGNCYFASSTHDNKHGAAFFRYQPGTGILTMLTNDITRVCGEDPTVTPPQGKIHSDIVETNGWLYFATHLGNYWLEAETNYTGAHVVGYELATGHFRDFGVIRSNYTIYAGIGLDPVRNKLIVYTTRDWTSPTNSYLYRIDIPTGTKELLGAVPGIAAFWFFVDNQGDCWLSPQSDNGSLLRVRSATGQIDRWDNVQPSDELQGDRFWAWAQPLPDGNRCVFRLQDGNNLYVFDANAFRNNPSTGFSVVQNIGPYGLGMALGLDRVFYIQRASRQDGQQEYQDFHLLSVSLQTNATPVILDHGLVVDQSGRLIWRIPGLAADPQNCVYMVGDWWLLPGEKGSPTGTLRHVDGPGTNYEAVVRGEFFATVDLSPVLGNPSACRITSIAQEANDVRLTWTAVGSHSYVVQTNAVLAGGSISNSFADFGSLISVPGTGASATNYLDRGAITNAPSRFYRVRLKPY